MDTSTAPFRAHGRDRWQVPRSRGALSGLLLILLGLWGALIPFIGPYVNFGFTPDAWSWTAARFWLEVLPGALAVLGGLMLLFSGNRATASLGATLACLAGAWFVVGPDLAQMAGSTGLGQPLGGDTRQAFEWISFFRGLGAVILFLGATALGRLSVLGVRDVEVARRRRLGSTGRHAARSRGRRDERPLAEEEVYPSEPQWAEPARERHAEETRYAADRPEKGRMGGERRGGGYAEPTRDEPRTGEPRYEESRREGHEGPRHEEAGPGEPGRKQAPAAGGRREEHGELAGAGRPSRPRWRDRFHW